MKFTKNKGDFFTIGRTPDNATISFADVPEDRLTICDPKKNTESIDTYIGRNKIDEVKPSVITLYCTFEVTTSMLDALEKSKIVQVKGLRNEKKQIELYPLFGFEFKKLQDLLYDLSLKFKF